ncbi:MAG TPA: DHHA1 domain-containing protein, partial [Rhabdochlamydiaceae bacterium]|nr:DHHA1 domain-containing protein [Rhabdochlamydiaceae bacterium]
ERKDSDDIDQYISKNPDIFKERALVLYSRKWHPGIIPIITARIAKNYNRPTLVIAIDDGIGKGSLRTISEFPLLPTLKEHADLLLNFGGHDYAAGLMIKEENIEKFKTKFIQTANRSLKEVDIRAKFSLDAKISFNDLTFDFMESLNLLEPFGNGNPAPIFYCEVKQIWPPKVVGKSHLKLYFDQNDRMLEGIGFGMADRRDALLKKNLSLMIAFSPHINNFLNKSSIQLQVKDFQVISK